MREAHALCVLAQLAAALAHLYTTSNVDKHRKQNRSVDFVRNIREDLRRDNDDYSAVTERHADNLAYQKLHQPLNQIPKPNPKPAPGWDTRRAQNLSVLADPIPPLPQPPQDADDAMQFRGASQHPQARGMPPQGHGMPPQGHGMPPQGHGMPPQGHGMPPQGHGMPPQSHDMPPQGRGMPPGGQIRHGYKKVRVDKLKRLIHKGKMRLQDLARNTGATPITRSDAGQPELQKKMEGILGSIITPSMTPMSSHHVRRPQKSYAVPVDNRPRPPAISSEAEVAVGREQAASVHAKSPAPDQLDMAPGRGSHIHIMRLKGILCQRNVLHPEGPVYNSRGSSIMPAHKPELAHGRQFPDTRAPLLLLPKCCNCCKKSVLGCQ